MSVLDGFTHCLDTVRPPPLSFSIPTIPSYHLLSFGSFTAEGTGLPAGKVLGEVAIEHAEAA